MKTKRGIRPAAEIAHLQKSGATTIEADGGIQKWNVHLRWPCGCCGKRMRYDRDYFVIRDYLWKQACRALIVDTDDILCVACVERGLERPLTRRDFKPCGVTAGFFGFDIARFAAPSRKAVAA